MITEYEEYQVSEQPWLFVRCWDARFWLDGEQLKQLFHISKGQLEYGLEKIKKKHLHLAAHCAQFSIVKHRKQAKSLPNREWIHQVQHYDPWIIEKFYELYPCEDAQQYLNWVKKEVVPS